MRGSGWVMSTDDDCDYCYGSMGLCPVCGPFEYAPSEAVGYDPQNGKHQADHVDGWDLSGRMPDWHDNANARGWCWRDTTAFLDVMYSVAERLNELAFKPLGRAVGKGFEGHDDPQPTLVVTNINRGTGTVTVSSADWAIAKPFQWAPKGNRHERRKAAAIARRKHA